MQAWLLDDVPTGDRHDRLGHSRSAAVVRWNADHHRPVLGRLTSPHVGGATVEPFGRSRRPGGHLVACGGTSGPAAAPNRPRPSCTHAAIIGAPMVRDETLHASARLGQGDRLGMIVLRHRD